MIYPNDETWRFPFPGIYALTYKNTIIYIGQAKNIEDRLEQHFNTDTQIRTILAKQQIEGFGTPYDLYTYKTLSLYCFITANYNDIGITCLLDCPIEELNQWEEALIKLHKPKYNWGGVDVPFHPYN